jgi:hypothetical protein
MRHGQEIAEGSTANPSGCEFNPSFIYIYIFVFSSVLLKKEIRTERKRKQK